MNSKKNTEIARHVSTTINVAWGRDALMPVAAVRYCLGRQTYIVSDCVDWLLGCWQLLPARIQALIKQDIEEAFERDDRMTGGYRALGADCDRKEWERVRKLWGL